ncbi:MAG: mercuric reductase [Gemmataceae bacterium]
MSELIVPWDEHNQNLVAHVHPSDWANPEPAAKYNLVVIGAGTAGLVTAGIASILGAKVALIERHLMGGDCLNSGCVPSKALLHAAHVYGVVRDAGETAVRVPDGTTVDFPAVMERMRRLRAHISPNDSAERFRNMGTDVFLGAAKFVGEDTVEVSGKTLRFKRAIIATGGRAAAPPIPGLDEVSYLTNETLFSLTELPRRFAILGGGPIGCEMAQAFARFGSEVSLIEMSDGVLPREDKDASAVVQASLVKDGVNLMLNTKVSRVEKHEQGVKVVVSTDGQDDELVADQFLVAAGRTPNVEGLGLETVGVEYDKHGIKIDDRLRTTNKRIFAIGDVASKHKFTHAADFMARTVVRNALFPGTSDVSKLIIPWCTYTSPELAHVGLSENDAAAQNIPIDTFTQSMDDVDRAILEGETEGFVKIHCKKGTDKILGATIVAGNAGDMISMITMAMKQKIGLGSIASVIHPYPTQAEAIRKLGDEYNRTRLTSFAKGLFKKWFSWTR